MILKFTTCQGHLIRWQMLHQESLWVSLSRSCINDLRGKNYPKGHSVEQEILKYKSILVIPKNSFLVMTLLKEIYDNPIDRHNFKTYQRMSSKWFWQGMRRVVTKYVPATKDILCLSCWIFTTTSHR